MTDPHLATILSALSGVLAPLIVAMLGYTIRRERLVERRLTRIEHELGLNGD